MTNINGIKKAVGDYNRANQGGVYDAHYGLMMLDRESGKVWVDEFDSIGHNNWAEYDSKAIINLVKWAEDRYDREDRVVNMANVRTWAEQAIAEYNN